MGILDRYKKDSQEKLQELPQDELAKVAFEALQTVRLLDRYAAQKKKIIARNLLAQIKLKEYDRRAIPFEDLYDDNKFEKEWTDDDINHFFAEDEDRIREPSTEELVQLSTYIGLDPYNMIFPENAMPEASYIPYYLLPTRSDPRYRHYSNLRASAEKEIYILGVGFTKAALDAIWKDTRGKNIKFRFLAYDIEQYDNKNDADAKHFEALMCEENYVQTCRTARGVMDDYQARKQDEEVQNIIDRHTKEKKKGKEGEGEKGKKKIKAIDLQTEFRYYYPFLPLNVTLIDPHEKNGAALFENILPFTEMTYKEMQFGIEDDTTAWPRPIFCVTKKDDPAFFQAIVTFISALWKDAEKKWNSRREIAKKLINAGSLDDDALIAAYTGLSVEDIKSLREGRNVSGGPIK